MKLKPYEKYKPSGIDWIEEIPEDWDVRRVKDIITKLDQGWSPNAENRIVQNGEFGVLKLSAVKNGNFFEMEHKALSITTKPNKAYEVKIDDVYITRSNTPFLVGDCCLVQNIEHNLFYSDLIYKLKINKNKFNNKFLVNQLISSLFRSKIISSAKGLNDSMVKISQKSIKGWEIITPINFQSILKIIKYLDQKTSQIDRKIDLLEQKLQKYEELKKVLINETVCRGLDKNVELKKSGIEWIDIASTGSAQGIPKHWEVRRVKEIFLERKERNKLPNGDPKTHNILSVMKDIGVINHKSKGNVGNKMSEDISSYKLVYIDDIVVNKMNVMIGSVGISKEFGALSVIYIILQTLKSNNSKYYNYLFKSKLFQRYLRTIATGILEIREALNMTLFAQQELPNPFLNEQTQIADYLDEKCNKIDKIKATIKKEIAILKELRKTLINDVVTGKVRIN